MTDETRFSTVNCAVSPMDNTDNELEQMSMSQPIVIDQTLIRPLRRLSKQNENLRLRLKEVLDKKPLSSPKFIDHLNKQVNTTFPTKNIQRERERGSEKQRYAMLV
jgi:hypothetical protein